MARQVGFFFAALVLVGALLFSGAVQAQTLPLPTAAAGNAKSLREPDIKNITILTNIVRGGAKLYYIGERSGMHGWFIVKNGQIQVIYLSPDKKTALIGAMFTDQGENVSSAQINALAARDREVYVLLNGAAMQQSQITQAGIVEGGVASVPSDPATAKSVQGESGVPAMALSPGDRLFQDLKAAAGVNMGRPDTPEIMMIIAPRCPNCQKTWKELRAPIKDGQVQVRLIPVYNSLGGDEANEAAHILTAKDPFEAWDKFAAGDAKALGGPADDIALRAITSNLNLVSRWNIKGYPYIVYRGKDGRIKIVQGRPERMAAVLVDLAR